MDTEFFYFSKILWSLFSPDTLLLYLLCAGALCLMFNRLKAARILVLVTTCALLLIAVLPVGHWLLYPLEKRFAANPQLPAKVDGIILLGGTINAQMAAAWAQSELGNSAEREFAFIQLGRQYPQAKLV